MLMLNHLKTQNFVRISKFLFIFVSNSSILKMGTHWLDSTFYSLALKNECQSELYAAFSSSFNHVLLLKRLFLFYLLKHCNFVSLCVCVFFVCALVVVVGNKSIFFKMYFMDIYIYDCVCACSCQERRKAKRNVKRKGEKNTPVIIASHVKDITIVKKLSWKQNAYKNTLINDH